MPDMVKAKEFADKLVKYMHEYGNLDTCNPDEAVKQTILLLTGDIGAAQEFLRILDVDVDLYKVDL